MHPRVTAQRSSEAQNRAVAAAQKLAAAHGIKPEVVAGLAVYERDPETRLVLRQEAVADLLEALVKSKPAKGDDKLQAEADALRAQVEDLKDRLKKAESKPPTKTASK